jgi:hypothetical protein
MSLDQVSETGRTIFHANDSSPQLETAALSLEILPDFRFSGLYRLPIPDGLFYQFASPHGVHTLPQLIPNTRTFEATEMMKVTVSSVAGSGRTWVVFRAELHTGDRVVGSRLRSNMGRVSCRAAHGGSRRGEDVLATTQAHPSG